MIAQNRVTAAADGGYSPPDGTFFDVVMLQLHVAMAAVWFLVAVLVALIAVPQLRRIPSALGLHVLQVRREVVLNALWGTFLLTLATGTYLLLKQAAYDAPPFDASWSELKGEPYAVPYFYALYAKIAIFLLMGAASFVLATEASRAAKESEDAGGPVELDMDADDEEWLDDEVVSVDDDTSSDAELPSRDVADTATATQTRAARRVDARARVPLAGLWGSFAVLVAGIGGVGFCVTLIKYFHELSKAATVYEMLRRGG